MSAVPLEVAVPRPLPSNLKVVRSSRSYCCAYLGNVFLVVWNEAPTVAALDQMQQDMGELQRSCPKGGGMLVVSRASSPGDHNAVKRSTDGLRAMAPWLKALAGVNGGTGILAKLVRVMMQTITTLAGNLPVECKLFGVPAEAAQWLAGGLGRAGCLEVTEAELQAGLAALLELYPPPAENA